MPLIIAIVFLIILTVLFHFLSPWWFTPIASNWTGIDLTIEITFWVTGAVFIGINLFVAYSIYKYRYNKNRRSKYEPENKKLELWLTGLTTVGVAALLVPGLFVWADFVNVPDDAHEVEVIGQQWQWSYRYPGADGLLGAADAANITAENPFGMVADDPNGQDDILVSTHEMHLPLDLPVKLLLRSKDVLHNYSVAQFRVKMDMVPGSVSYMWLTPTLAGTYDILCEELCGLGHFVMRGNVVVEEEESYNSWLDSQMTYAQLNAQAVGNPQVGQALYAVCSACHGINGEGNEALNAPRLTGLEPWYIKRQINNYKTGVRGAENDVIGMTMTPMAAVLADDAAINNVAAYIGTLPEGSSPLTVTGDAENGKAIYEPVCGICHSEDGEGIWAVNAPALAGMNDWYLVRQLQNFKSGVRGAHRDDRFGSQMTGMVLALEGDEAINDVVSYINTLK
jgi:cytochrome c oxidase subunit 2